MPTVRSVNTFHNFRAFSQAPLSQSRSGTTRSSGFSFVAHLVWKATTQLRPHSAEPSRAMPTRKDDWA